MGVRGAPLAGIGFTIALLLGELSFPQPADSERIKTAVLISSLLAATLATLVLKRRNHIYRRLNQEEERQNGSNSGEWTQHPRPAGS